MEEEGEEITGKRAGPECGPPGGLGGQTQNRPLGLPTLGPVERALRQEERMKDRRLGLPGEAPNTAGWSTVMLNAEPRPSDATGNPGSANANTAAAASANLANRPTGESAPTDRGTSGNVCLIRY